MPRKQKRVYFQAWGARGALKRTELPAYAIWTDAGLSRAQAVADAIGRKAGLTAVTMHWDGSSELGQIYEVTYGYRLPSRTGGGWAVEGSIWVAIPNS